MIVPVILSGGMGTRLWPFSRELQPKQLMGFSGEYTLLQDTAARLHGLLESGPPIVVCNDAHRFVVAEQLRAIDVRGAEIVLEPMGRNTAPAIAIGALRAMERSEDALILVMPADHRIGDVPAFQAAVRLGADYAAKDEFVVFGVTPTGPETGYGYIRNAGLLGEQVHRVAEFVEKPDLETAQSYVSSGAYSWNSGMFLMKASTYLRVLAEFEPDMARYSQLAYSGRSESTDFVRLDEEAFGKCPSNSIDYAVMERAERVAVVALDCQWNDLGAWRSVWEDAEKDAQGNALIGDALALETSNSLVFSTHRMVTAVGMDNVAVVETSDAVLVVDKSQDQLVKALVSQLKGREEVHAHLTVERPWGSYTRLREQEGFQVKRIVVKPGASLSLQKHHHRSEHWVIVRGVGRITNGEDVFELGHSGHTYIPKGAVHRLENPGTELLELIEVQLGEYLGEDDIVRLEDRYGRG